MKKCLSHSYLYQKKDEQEIINLNVGGQLFTTSRQTLTSIGDTFFTALLSGRISSQRDSSGAIFVDRDPKLFAIILNYLRTRQLFDIDNCNLDMLLHESQFYGITPLVRRLELCDQLYRKPTCGGDILFQAQIRSDRGQPVRQVVAHHNAIAVAHNHVVTCYRLKDTMGWQLVFESQPIDELIEEIAFYYNCGLAPLTGPKLMLAIKDQKSIIRLWSITVSHYNTVTTNNSNDSTVSGAANPSQKQEIGRFHLNKCCINSMFFIGSQLGKN